MGKLARAAMRLLEISAGGDGRIGLGSVCELDFMDPSLHALQFFILS